jgi:ABC-2 type transport system permease protein
VSGMIIIGWSGQVGWLDVPRVMVAILASAIVFVASGVMFFSLAFWLGKVDTLARQLWELVITFALYPEPLFGGALRLVLFTLIPAGWIGYVPARLAQQTSWSQLLLLIAAAAFYLAAAAVTFDRGLRRYVSGSRFAAFG